MKKTLYLFLTALICLTMTACGKKDEKSVEVGDYIKFGEYEQDGDKSNGKEPIEWLVLDKEDDKILVVSKHALDCKPYNEEAKDVTWEECTLREWLNKDFINEAFSEKEKDVIPEVTITTNENPVYYTGQDYDTEDRVFLLSIDEAEEYFNYSDNNKKCKPTKQAVGNGALENNYMGNTCWWWLRSPGDDSDYAVYVYCNGEVEMRGLPVDFEGAVRPALWIETK